jgi:TRAP-type C4-dicarboxylate transport system permease small subunit
MRHELEKVGRLLDGWLGHITSICLVIAGAAIALMALITTYSVVRRYIFHSPDSSAILISCIMMVACVIFAIAHIERLKKNITVDYISQYIPRKIREPLLRVSGPLLGLILGITLTLRTWDNALFALQIGQKTDTLPAIPTFPLQIAIPCCTGLLCLVLIADLVRYLTSLKGKTSRLK